MEPFAIMNVKLQESSIERGPGLMISHGPLDSRWSVVTRVWESFLKWRWLFAVMKNRLQETSIDR